MLHRNRHTTRGLSHEVARSTELLLDCNMFVLFNMLLRSKLNLQFLTNTLLLSRIMETISFQFSTPIFDIHFLQIQLYQGKLYNVVVFPLDFG
jgi:hypothetical protein